MNSLLEQGLNRLGIECSERQFEQLVAYIAEIELWNRKMNLVADSERDKLVIRHLLDSLAPLNILKNIQAERVADVGSGGGFPGIPLAVMLPELKFSLIERSGKKAGFLRSTAAVLGLVDRVEVVQSNIEEVHDSFELTVLRAFRDFSEYYGELLRITKPEGTIAAYKGRMDSVQADLKRCGISEGYSVKEVDVPFLEEERNLLLIRPKH